MSSGLGDIANIVLKQMEIGDGPCKYLLQHREIVREPGQDTFTNVSILHAFNRRGKMFFLLKRMVTPSVLTIMISLGTYSFGVLLLKMIRSVRLCT